MKTGRVRTKADPTPEEPKPTAAETVGEPPSSQPYRPSPPRSGSGLGAAGVTTKPSKPPYLILGILAAVLLCIVIFVIFTIVRGGANEWVEATRVDGTYTASLTIFGPQVNTQERWETDCTSDPNGTVRIGTCISKDSDTYQDQVIEDYDEYAYNIYHEETWDKTYQAQGTEFAEVSLGSDDWWDGNFHHTRVEELDKDSCSFTNYTVWVDDPKDTTQEIEVVLSDCEVWDHVVVEERVYDQKSWCQCDVTTLVQTGQQSAQGTGLNIEWPAVSVPTNGKTERSFQGQVTFLGDDHAYTTTTTDLAQYQDYLTSQYYIGLRDDKPMTISKNPKD